VETTSSDAVTFPEKLAFEDATVYNAGMYKIGLDLPAGIYVAMGDGSVISSVTVKDGSGADANVLTVDPFTQHTIIGVEDGQYLDVLGADMIAVEYTASIGDLILSEVGCYVEGMYWVGYHIPTGEYKLTADSEAVVSSYTIYGDATRGTPLDVGVMSGDTAYVTLEDGQFIKLSGVTMVGV
jgi:hypothetical protein